MSHSVEPSDDKKPVVKEKDPHNYRKVGYSMIVISVSLVAIGLLVWAIGSNYHFASDIMAGQEIDAMTPKSGYTLVAFDYTQPVGAKIKYLDHADNLVDAKKSQSQDIQEKTDSHVQILIFTSFRENNTDSIELAEILSMTPSDGYNIISLNPAFPAGAKLSNLKHETKLVNATNDQKNSQDDQTKVDPAIKVMIFGSNYDDNLSQVLGNYDPNMVSKNLNQFVVPPPAQTETQNATSVTTQIPASSTTASNQTTSANQTGINQGNFSGNSTMITKNPIDISLGENVTINASSPSK